MVVFHPLPQYIGVMGQSDLIRFRSVRHPHRRPLNGLTPLLPFYLTFRMSSTTLGTRVKISLPFRLLLHSSLGDFLKIHFALVQFNPFLLEISSHYWHPFGALTLNCNQSVNLSHLNSFKNHTSY